MRGDRIFGLVMLVLAVGYALTARSIETSFMSDPVGPRIFPYLIAAVIAVSSLVMILRPDPDVEWPAGPMLGQLGLALALLVGYAFAIGPLGFILPTIVASGVLSYLIHPDARKAALTGVGLGIGLFVLFRVILGLGLTGLPTGWGF